MNVVWKDLDPIFKDTLRKYATESNRLLFDVYAKAVGFNPTHVGLLYLTLKLEQDEFETRNRKRSYTETIDSDGEHVHNTQNDEEEHKEDHTENAYLQISVYKNHENASNNNETIEDESTSTDTLPLPSLDTERPSKRRKTCTNEMEHVQSIKEEIDQNNVAHEPLEPSLPWIHSVVCKNFESNTNVTNIPMEDNHTNNGTEGEELSDYERLKALSNRFKHQKLPKSVVQNNKKKIALLANCDVYRESLMRRHSLMTRTRTIRHTVATATTVANYTQNSNLLSSK